jgi:hypothetical protein
MESRPQYILATWMKLFAATRSNRNFNNPVSFDEKRAPLSYAVSAVNRSNATTGRWLSAGDGTICGKET